MIVTSCIHNEWVTALWIIEWVRAYACIAEIHLANKEIKNSGEDFELGHLGEVRNMRTNAKKVNFSFLEKICVTSKIVS